MAATAPLSKYKKQNCIIGIAVLLVLGAWFAYDGYLNETFKKEHTTVNEEGEKVPDSDLVFNRKSPPFFLAGALLLGGYFFVIKNKKLVADENSLVTPKMEIPYDSIEKIDKTYFKKKGYFVVTYKENGSERTAKFSDRTYDNLEAVLDEMVKKIS